MIMHRSSIRSGRIALLSTLLAVTFSTAGTARAEPAIDRIEPGGGTRGSDVEIALTGKELADPEQLWFENGSIAVVSLTAVDAAHAKAKPLAQHIGPLALAAALAWCALMALLVPWLATRLNGAAGPLAGLSPVRLGLAALVAAGVALWCGRWLRRRLGGFTGDGLGATQQWCELGVYLALAAGHGA